METDAQGVGYTALLTSAWGLEGWQEGKGDSYHCPTFSSRETLTPSCPFYFLPIHWLWISGSLRYILFPTPHFSYFSIIILTLCSGLSLP